MSNIEQEVISDAERTRAAKARDIGGNVLRSVRSTSRHPIFVIAVAAASLLGVANHVNETIVSPLRTDLNRVSSNINGLTSTVSSESRNVGDKLGTTSAQLGDTKDEIAKLSDGLHLDTSPQPPGTPVPLQSETPQDPLRQPQESASAPTTSTTSTTIRP